MGVEEALCMKGGSGETSYASNSAFQRNIIREMRSTLEESIRAICATISPECLAIADHGCSTGPNTLAVLQSIIDVVVSTSQDSGLPIPEFKVFMNDLPQNDFNTIFKSLPGFYKKIEEEKGVEIACFVSGTPGSFYGRVFPSNSIHFMHCSTSLHFLSKAPERFVGDDGKEALNKGRIYATKSSPPEVLKAYRVQFAKDFTKFLRCRSKEIINGGGVVLCFVVTHDDEANPFLEVTSKALYKLACEGLINKGKLDAFNLPLYTPTVQQVKQLIEAEGSFILHKHNTFTLTWGNVLRSTKAESNTHQVGIRPSKATKFITNAIRAGYESMIASEFGEEIIHTLFGLVEDMVMKDLGVIAEDLEVLNTDLSLIRKT